MKHVKPRLLPGLIALWVAVAAGCATPEEAPAPASVTPFDGLIAAERGFAAASRAHGVREAFLANLAENSTVFRPGTGPVDGRQSYSEGTPPTGTLDWYPARAEVAPTDDLGYTTGPWEYRAEGSEPTYGHYMSVWRRQTDGSWKVELDIGIQHAEPPSWTDRIEPEPGPARASVEATRTAFEAVLMERDLELAAATRESDPVSAYRTLGADDVTLYRNEAFPAGLSTPEGPSPSVILECTPAHAGASTAGDLGYTYGSVEIETDAGPAARHYARIWRNTPSGPRLVLDIEIP